MRQRTPRGLLIGVFLLISAWALRGQAYEVTEVTNGGAIIGEVTFAGTLPAVSAVEITKDQEVCGKTEKTVESILVGQNRGLRNVVVSLRDLTRGKGFPAAPSVLDQQGCQYAPHIVLVPVGAPLSILNSDGILHSVHTHSTKNPAFNRSQSKFKKELQESFVQPEFIKVTCDVHPWMEGWIIVQEHPYVTVTAADGSFRLDQVPAGTYRLRLWHEKLGEQEKLVEIVPGVAVRVVVSLGE